MEKRKGNNIRLGVFVSFSLFLLIAGIYFVGSRQQLFGSSFRIHAIFKDVGGLQVGNNIRFSGINVGIVEDIEQYNDSSVIVDMLIDKSTKKFIKKDAKAIIGSDGLMGNKIVEITPGTGKKPEIQNNDFIKTVLPISFDDVLLKLKITSDNSAKISENLSEITDNIREGKGTIGMLFMDTAFANNLQATLENIREGAGGFKKNMDAASKSFLLKGAFKKNKK
jgi:phospholipid/cholesterol/gamma-HCH transport system substrate-binding protein